VRGTKTCYKSPNNIWVNPYGCAGLLIILERCKFNFAYLKKEGYGNGKWSTNSWNVTGIHLFRFRIEFIDRILECDGNTFV